MDEWGMNPGSVAAMGTVVSAVALIVAMWGAWLAYRQGRKDRNLQGFIAISEDIRQRWETGWQEIVREKIPSLNLTERHEGHVGEQLEFMLNWLDWLGLIVRMRLVDPQLVLGSLGPMVAKIIREASYKIQSDMDDPKKGKTWWKNVLHLAELPEVAVDVHKEATGLVKKWGEPQSLRRGARGVAVFRPTPLTRSMPVGHLHLRACQSLTS